MTKRRKKPQKSVRRSPSKVNKLLAEAMRLYEDGEVGLALQKLKYLAQVHPRSKSVLTALLDVSHDLEDWRTYAYYAEKLLPNERGIDRVETQNNLIYAYIQTVYPALAWFHSKQLAKQSIESAYRIQAQELMAKIEPMLLENAAQVPHVKNASKEDKLNFLMQMDRIRFLVESGYPDEAIVGADDVLKKYPDVVSILNNLSLAYFMNNEIDRAVATAEKVLTQDEDNFHALGNLVRFTFLTGRFEEAKAYAEHLRQISGEFEDLETKQAEAFAFLGDDEEVWAAYLRHKSKNVDDSNPLILHLAAVAAYRLGNEDEAWALWKEAVKLFPSFEFAQACLAEKKWKVGERTIPWYWTLSYWLPQNFEQLMQKYLGKNLERASEKDVERGMTALLAERPFLVQLFPHMLERGDTHTRGFVLNFIRVVGTPELAQICYDFARNPFGSDGFRMEAMQYISQNHPHMLPEDKMVPLWVNGQQQDLFMLAFEISFEPDDDIDFPDDVLDKHEQAYDLMQAGSFDEAEEILLQIIEESPEFFTAYNQLAFVYENQGHANKARQLVEETHQRYPDYLFARTNLARMKIKDGKVEEAKELLQPVLLLPKLHISEFRALAQAEMDVSLAEGRTESARHWLDMWKQIDEEDEAIEQWDMRINGPGFLEGLRNFLQKNQ